MASLDLEFRDFCFDVDSWNSLLLSHRYVKTTAAFFCHFIIIPGIIFVFLPLQNYAPSYFVMHFSNRIFRFTPKQGARHLNACDLSG